MNQWAYFQWGLSTDIPVPSDFDGDGPHRPGRLPAVERRVVHPLLVGGYSPAYPPYQWGLATDVPIVR